MTPLDAAAQALAEARLADLLSEEAAKLTVIAYLEALSTDHLARLFTDAAHRGDPPLDDNEWRVWKERWPDEVVRGDHVRDALLADLKEHA